MIAVAPAPPPELAIVTGYGSRQSNKQCHADRIQYGGDDTDNPIWFAGHFTLADCMAACDIGTDGHGRPCVAIEWSDGGGNPSAGVTEDCALAWACDSLASWNKHWFWKTGGGSVFFKEAASLGECEGDCNTDNECDAGLKCWTRDSEDWSLPPGCIGTSDNTGLDYCYDPNDNKETKNLGGNPSQILKECEGDCDKDTDCLGNMICWHRGSWSSNLPPGCKGNAFAPSHDFCYDGSKSPSNSLPPDDAESDKSTDIPIERGDGYALIARHKNAADGMFSSSVLTTGVENAGNPNANTYSIIGSVDTDQFRFDDGRYELELIYYYSDGTIDTLDWSQMSWVNEARITGADLSQIVDNYDSGNERAFHGLAASTTTYTYLDGTDNHDYWFHAVASTNLWNGGIPAHHGKAAYGSELWVRLKSGGSSSAKAPVFEHEEEEGEDDDDEDTEEEDGENGYGDSARASLFGYQMLNDPEPGKDSYIPHDDGIGNGDYVIELSASDLLMFAAAICVVVTVIVVVVLCKRPRRKHVVYRKVVVHSDSDLEAERLK